MSDTSLMNTGGNDNSPMILGEYNGTLIECRPGDQFINATAMCHAAGKRWTAYWANSGTQEFITALAENLQGQNSDLVISVHGGQGEKGTWVHRRIAIDLARWCSPQFAVWVTEKIDQLMTTGKVILHPEYQEAELVSRGVIAEIRQIAIQIDKSNQITQQSHQLAQQQSRLCFEVLKELQSRPVHRLESVVESELVKIEGGKRQAEIAPGHRVDVLKPGKEAIEIKHWKNCKAAVGQIVTYDIYLSGHIKRVHLFEKPFDKLPSEKQRHRIELECEHSGIRVTWHDWRILKQQREQFLELHFDSPPKQRSLPGMEDSK